MPNNITTLAGLSLGSSSILGVQMVLELLVFASTLMRLIDDSGSSCSTDLWLTGFFKCSECATKKSGDV